MKLFLHLDGDDDNTLLQTLLTAARMKIEAKLSQVMLHQDWRFIMNHWPARKEFKLPMSPLHNILAARIFDASGTSQTIRTIGFAINNAQSTNTLVRPDTLQNPGRAYNGIELDLRLGMAATPAAVPEPLRLAVLELAGFWYEHRTAGTAQHHMPETVTSLLTPYKKVQL